MEVLVRVLAQHVTGILNGAGATLGAHQILVSTVLLDRSEAGEHVLVGTLARLLARGGSFHHLHHPAVLVVPGHIWLDHHGGEVKERSVGSLEVEVVAHGELPIAGAHHDRLVHVLEVHVASQLSEDAFIHDLANLLLVLVLGVDAILSLFDSSVLELLEVVVRIVALVCVTVLLVHEQESRVVLRASTVIITSSSVAHARLHTAVSDLILVLLIDVLELFVELFVVGRLTVVGSFLEVLELNGKVAGLDLVLVAAVVAELPLHDVHRAEQHAEDHQGG